MADVEMVYFPWVAFQELTQLACEHRNSLYADRGNGNDAEEADEEMEVATPPTTVSYTQPPRTKLFYVRVLPVSKSCASITARGPKRAKFVPDSTSDFASKLCERLVSTARLVNKDRPPRGTIIPEICSMPSAYYDPATNERVGTVSMQLLEHLNIQNGNKLTFLENVLYKSYNTCIKLLVDEFKMVPVDPLAVSMDVEECGPVAVLTPSYRTYQDNQAAVKRLFALAATGYGCVLSNGKHVVWFGSTFQIPWTYVRRNMTEWMRTSCPIYLDNPAYCDSIVQHMVVGNPKLEKSIVRDLVESLADDRRGKLPFHHISNPTPSVFTSDSSVPLCIEKEAAEWFAPQWLQMTKNTDNGTCTCKNCFDPNDYSDEDDTTCEDEVCMAERKKRTVKNKTALQRFCNGAPLECLKQDMLVNTCGRNSAKYYVVRYTTLTTSHFRVHRHHYADE